MAGKKTGSRMNKQRRASAPKAAARRGTARKSDAASRKAVAASAAKPAPRSARPSDAARGTASSSAHPAGAAVAKPTTVAKPPTVAKPAAPAKPPAVARPAAAAKPADAVPGVDATRSVLTPRALSLPEGDETDGVEPGSLLAGPRNVKPYVAKRGELYMSKEQLAHFQQILLNWKRDLMEEVDRTVSHMKDEAANFPDPNDRATQEEEFSLELRTRDRERKLIRKIDEALKRIEDGTYGYCLETGEEIGIKRLEARPVATLSIEAQERRERRERQYGDRDDRYR